MKFLKLKFYSKPQNYIFSRKVIRSESDLIFSKPLSEEVETSAFMTSMTDVIYRNQKNYKTFILKVCKEQLFTVNIVMYFPKNFYLREAINVKLSELSTAGLLQYHIQKKAEMKFFNMISEQKGPKKLNIHHLTGVVNIWLIGCAISLVIFLIEVLNSNLRQPSIVVSE